MKNVTIHVHNHTLTMICALFIAFTSFSQGHMIEIPFSDQIANSSSIIEGKVLSKKSFWDLNRQNIYTVNTVEVYKTFKGPSDATIEIITEGGVVDLRAQMTSLSLDLSVGDMGVFMLHDTNIRLSAESTTELMKYESYSAIQGFYKYDVYDNKVSNPYLTLDGISNKLYSRIMAYTESEFIHVTDFDINRHIQTFLERNIGGLALSNFDPVIITGGTGSILTIDGSGFGPNPGSILFRDANSGGTSYFTTLDSQIVSWTDTQIQVEVPSRAGSGTFRVVTSIGPFIDSTSPLLISFSQINVTTQSNVAYPTQHANNNGSGGYDWSMYTTFFLNNAAKQSFTRALDTWRCETGINWDIDATLTSINTAALDGTNIIRFDNGDELPNGVLGRTTSYFNGCSNGSDLEWFIEELDMVFNDGTNWQFGPAAPSNSQIDFESVAVHELGHAHQLAHVIDNNAIMHYAIGPGNNNRVLSVNDILGGNDVQLRSTTNEICNSGLMTNHGCSLGIDENELSNYISVFPNPAKNEFFIKNNYHSSIEKIELFDMTGRSVKNSNFTDSQGLYTLSTNNLSSGVYLININLEGKTLTKKIILQ